MKSIVSQVLNYRNFSKLILCGLLLLTAGCKDKDPFVDPGDTPSPNWVLTVDTTDLTASMTAIVKVSFANSEGTLAAFMGADCCGIAEYKAENDLYWLYVSPGTEEGSNVQLRFYSPDLKRIFDAKETFSFVNDGHLGSVSAPYTPEWTAAK